MARLPTVGGDNSNWGTILNEYLSVEHNPDGSLKLRTDNTFTPTVADGSITASKLSSSVNSYLASAQTAVQSVNGKTGQAVTLAAADISGVVQTSALGAASGVATLDGSSKLTSAQLPTSVATKSASSGDTGKAIDAYTGAPLGVITEAVESVGTKLRRLAAQSKGDNPWSRPYMRACPPWQPSTAYIRGNVVVNGGNRYICITAGTSASSGGPTIITGNAQVDGGVLAWTFFGYNDVTTDPSLTQGAWVGSTAYTLGTQVINAGKVYGCVAAGTSAASGGPTGTTNSVTDGTATWTYMGVYRANPYASDFPTYSYSTSAPSGLTTLFNPANYPGGTGIVGAIVQAGGSGYAVNDTITLTGGTGTTAVLQVTSVASGAVTGVSIQTSGAYTVLPTMPTAQGSTSGSGSGATFILRFAQSPYMKLRGCYLSGSYASNYGEMATFQPAASAAAVTQHASFEFYSDAPKLYFRLGSGGGRLRKRYY